MFKIIPHHDKLNWDKVVTSFPIYDVYYLNGYVAAFKINGDGEPLLFYFDNGEMRGIYVAMKRDISDALFFHDKLPQGQYYDLISPYGYGGFLFDGNVSQLSLKQLKEELLSVMRENGIVSAFTRFNPILKNAHLSGSFVDVIDLGKTIALDLSNEEIIWDNIISKNRNMIRKAMKSGVKIYHTHSSLDLLLQFRETYNKTMENDNAEQYYYFPVEFYESIHRDLADNYELFYATMNDEIIAMSIILFANGKMHYHLSGSNYVFRKFAPSNLLLYEAALWGHSLGYKVFHLGGGVGSAEDSLYKFKAAFNRNSDYLFSIGKQIFNQNKYNQLVELRKRDVENFDAHDKFFPLYRS